MVRRDKTNYVIQSVAHALDVLEQFFGEVDELGVTELSKRLKLHKNNVFRLLATLEARGYIEQNKATENYRLGIKCLHLGRRYIHHMGLVRQARPILADLARKCRESAYVAIVRRDGVVPLEAAEAEDRAVRITPPIGIMLPLHCTAAGKAHLAFDAERLSAFIATLDTRTCDAIVLLATDLPTFGCLADLEAKFRLPILTSNQTLLWSALRVLKQRPAKPLGRLFER